MVYSLKDSKKKSISVSIMQKKFIKKLNFSTFQLFLSNFAEIIQSYQYSIITI